MATSTAQAIATVPVWDYLLPPGDPTNPNPKGLKGKRVTLTLTYSLAQSAAPVTLLGADPVAVQTDDNGFWQVNLVPNNKISPAGTLYKVEIEGYRSYLILVSDVGVPAIGWQSSAIAVLAPISGAVGYTLPGGTEVLGNLTVDGLLSVLGAATELMVTTAQGRIDVTHPNYGAVGDLRRVTDAAISTGQSVVTSATAAFTQSDVGKFVAIAAAVGGTGTQQLTSPIVSVQSATQATLRDAASATVSGKNACIFTDNAPKVQLAINYQQTHGGRLWVPHDASGGQYGFCNNIAGVQYGFGLIGAPGSAAGGFSDATIPVELEFEGREVAFIDCKGFVFDGLLGYQGTSKLAQWIVINGTLDGNYVGVGTGGVFAQPSASTPALVSLPWPFTAGSGGGATGYNGLYHIFLRVRFYRPAGFGFQPTQGIKALLCELDGMGQPDIASGATHIDNFGSGQGDLIALCCNWHDGSGNYADFVDGTGGAGHMLRAIMIACTSRNHQVGGIFAAGLGSVVALNRLSNNVAGSGVGYDIGTHASMKSKNIVVANVLTNMSVNGSGLSAASFGDFAFANQSDETNPVPLGQLPFHMGDLAFKLSVETVAFAASYTPDWSKGQYKTIGALTGNMTINNPIGTFVAAGPPPGYLLIFYFVQDGVGGRTIVWNAFFGNPVQPRPAAGAQSVIGFMSSPGGGWIYAFGP